MEIQSAFKSGVQGFQNAVETANKAATAIVAESTAAYDFSIRETGALEANTVSRESINNEYKIPDLNQSIIELKVAEYQAKAATEVIKTADDNLGTLLDVTA